MTTITQKYEEAKEKYASIGVDTANQNNVKPKL